MLVGSWWPSTAGALSLILPAGVFRMLAGSVGRYFPGVSCHGSWGIAFVAVALGTSAAWIRPATYALGPDCHHLILALSAAAAVLVYCFGRAIDAADHFPLAILPITLLLALVFGAGAFLGSPWPLWGVTGAAALTTVIHNFVTARRAALAGGDNDLPLRDPLRARRPRTIGQLRNALLSPIYQPPPEFERLRKTIVQSGMTQSRWIGLLGPSAAGKTAAAHELIRQLQALDTDLQILAGRCAEDSAPYQPFREALAALGVSSRLMTARSQGGNVNSIIDRLADEFIPFWDFFSGSVDDDDDDEERQKERPDLLAAITNGLHSLAQERRVLLFLDDIQWLDEGSAAVLKHLRETFAPGSETRLIIILASRDAAALERFDLKDDVVALSPPSAAEQVVILERSLGIEPASARRLVQALGVIGQEAGGMFWLVRAVQELVNENAFVATARGFALRPNYLQSGQLPVPAAMREKLAQALQASGEFQPVVECAALLGERFRVADVAECLGIDRLKLLEVLRHLDCELQLVRDIPNDEECYAFSSAFMLEIVRERLRVPGEKPNSRGGPSKIAQELHARIAAMFERRTPRTAELAYRIAQHCFAAGPACASRSVEHCVEAARAARRNQAYSLARKFLEMAEQSARLSRTTVDFDSERRAVEADEARSAERDPTRSAPGRKTNGSAYPARVALPVSVEQPDAVRNGVKKSETSAK
jgi:hypothetical protein